MKKNKHKSKNNTNTATNVDNKSVNNNHTTIPDYRLLSIAGGVAVLVGGYLWKQNGKTNTKPEDIKTNTDPCAKYKIGDQYDVGISNTIDVDFDDNNPAQIFRQGCTYKNTIINDYVFTHQDTTLIDLNFDIHPMIYEQPPQVYNFQGFTSSKYNMCSNNRVTDCQKMMWTKVR